MNESLRTRVVLADRRAPVRAALRLIVADMMGMQVVGEVACADELWGGVQSTQPELLVLDWGMVANQAATLLPAMRNRWPRLHIVALSGMPEIAPAVLMAGADAFVSKVDPPERLVQALRSGASPRP